MAHFREQLLHEATVPSALYRGTEHSVMDTALSKNTVSIILDYLHNNSFHREYLLYKSFPEKTHGLTFFNVLQSQTKILWPPLCWGWRQKDLWDRKCGGRKSLKQQVQSGSAGQSRPYPSSIAHLRCSSIPGLRAGLFKPSISVSPLSAIKTRFQLAFLWSGISETVAVESSRSGMTRLSLSLCGWPQTSSRAAVLPPPHGEQTQTTAAGLLTRHPARPRHARGICSTHARK